MRITNQLFFWSTTFNRQQRSIVGSYDKLPFFVIYFIFVFCRSIITGSYQRRSSRRWDLFQITLFPISPPASLFFCSTHIWPCVPVLWKDLFCPTITPPSCSYPAQQQVCNRLCPPSISASQYLRACHYLIR